MATRSSASKYTGEGQSTKKSGIFSLTTLFTLTVIAALIIGWNVREEYLWTAEYGLGYALGILGASLMIALLIYPLRKHYSRTPWLVFSTKTWFKIHMAMGVLGPLSILYHCNFSLGSTNSNITLAAMGLMVTSGLIGRFIYSKIHYSLFGRKIEIKELQSQRAAMHEQLDNDSLPDDILLNDLYAFEEKVLARRDLKGNLLNMLVLGLSSRWLLFRLIKKVRVLVTHKDHLKGATAQERKEYFQTTCQHLSSYIGTLKKIAGLGFYERLFSLWHMLHLPIFFMLVITAIAHVYAVHWY